MRFVRAAAPFALAALLLGACGTDDSAPSTDDEALATTSSTVVGSTTTTMAGTITTFPPTEGADGALIDFDAQRTCDLANGEEETESGRDSLDDKLEAADVSREAWDAWLTQKADSTDLRMQVLERYQLVCPQD